ncbi:MAG: hypothetical protein ACW98X_18010 [Promethearchaeota archaeon]|jgi:proteasome lid subunit RPN8/RPN11
MSGAEDFRYLIPESLFQDITQKCAEEYPNIVHGWLFAERKENFGICTKFTINADLHKSKVHVKPRSWMRYKKAKIYNMRKFKEELGVDIVYQWHSHPSGNEKLHAIDKRILKYLSHGVMIIVIPPAPDKTPEQKAHLVGWYYDKRTTKKPIIEKMVFEIISE